MTGIWFFRTVISPLSVGIVAETIFQAKMVLSGDVTFRYIMNISLLR